MDTSSDFNLLSTAAHHIRNDIDSRGSQWKDSEFEWIIYLPSGSKGKLGKLLIQQWVALKGLSVEKSPDSEADLLINGHRVEIKFSTLWDKGCYKFQQIRNQNYDFCICLGISPSTAHCWVISKKQLITYVIGHLGQHTGLKGTETAWFPVYPNNPPDWLLSSGGSLDEAFDVLKPLSKKKK